MPNHEILDDSRSRRGSWRGDDGVIVRGPIVRAKGGDSASDGHRERRDWSGAELSGTIGKIDVEKGLIWVEHWPLSKVFRVPDRNV